MTKATIIGDISVEHCLLDAKSLVEKDNRCHDKYELLFIILGSGKCYVEGREYSVGKGDVLLIKPLAHHYFLPDIDVTCEWYTVHFAKSSLVENVVPLLNELLATENNEEDNPGKYYPECVFADAFLSMFDRFEALEALPERQRLIIARLYLSELITLTSISSGEKIAIPEDELGARVIRYLNNNIERNISLDKLARHFFVSKYYLCRAFKKYTGVSVHSYINHKRIMYAKQLIEAGETASGAAERVGFGDYSAFYRAYIKILGKSPTAD